MSKKLKIEKDAAIAIYDEQDAAGKILLQRMWPGEFTTLPVMERIKTFKDVLDDQHITELAFESMIAGDTDDEAAYKRIKLIAKCLNEGELDINQTWYHPVFNRDAGFGFSDADYVYWTTDTAVGSRLSFKSRELARYAGDTFADIYKPFMLTLNQ